MQSTLFAILVTLLLVTVPYGFGQTTNYSNTTMAAFTTAPSNASTSNSTMITPTTATMMQVTNQTGFTTMNGSVPTTSRPRTTTPAKRVRKFDGLSFIGGMILATGLVAIIYLVVSYARRRNPLPYSNLH